MWVATSPDGRLLLSADDQRNTLQLWDVEARKEVCRVNWDTVTPSRGCFTPDGRRAIWPGKDGVMRMYRLPALAQGHTDQSLAPIKPGG